MRWGNQAIKFIKDNWESHTPFQIADLINEWLKERAHAENRKHIDVATPAGVAFKAVSFQLITYADAVAFQQNILQNRLKQRHIKKSIRLFVLKRDSNKCLCCGSIEELEIDHIVPIRVGGISDSTNLQTLCKKCHKIKGLDTVDFRKDFIRYPCSSCNTDHFRNLTIEEIQDNNLIENKNSPPGANF
ncbi:MAG: HNH endonuclease signature motif containing protein [Bacteroidia bacterium]